MQIGNRGQYAAVHQKFWFLQLVLNSHFQKMGTNTLKTLIGK